MTFREKLAKEHPECINPNCKGGVVGCPDNKEYGYEKEAYCRDEKGVCHPSAKNCTECWDREIPTEQTAEKTYEEGLQDAWELFKKTNDMSDEDYVNCFGGNVTMDGLTSLTPQEALAKLKAYEEAQEAEKMAKINVGDVVKYDGIQAVVMDIDTVGNVALFTENSCVESWIPQCFVAKAGKHIDIESLLGQIRGE